MWIFTSSLLPDVTAEINLSWVWKELHLVMLCSNTNSHFVFTPEGLCAAVLYCMSLSLSQPSVPASLSQQFQSSTDKLATDMHTDWLTAQQRCGLCRTSHGTKQWDAPRPVSPEKPVRLQSSTWNTFSLQLFIWLILRSAAEWVLVSTLAVHQDKESEVSALKLINIKVHNHSLTSNISEKLCINVTTMTDVIQESSYKTTKSVMH